MISKTKRPDRLFFKELVLSGLYSSEGVRSIPSDDRTKDHFEFSPRPPGNYFGFEYIQTFTPSSSINRKVLPDGFQLAAIDLHPRFVFDAMESRDDLNRLDFAPQDFWARFTLAGKERLSLRVGQFVLPNGANPIRSPCQQVILPVESLDLGLKWDWGLALKGPIGECDWEIAATIGSGEALHSPNLFRGSKGSSFLVTGRVGAPTYWDFQYGVSFLYGDLPLIRGANILSNTSVSRWRVAMDVFYKYGTSLLSQRLRLIFA